MNYKIKKNILKIYIVILTIITGMRYFNGYDYGAYQGIFSGIKTIYDYKYLEILFRFIIMLNNMFFKYHFNFIIFSVINFILLYLALKKIKYPMLGLFIYVNIFWINYSFNGIRQGIAMNCFLLALLSSDRLFIILALFASGIHKVSFIIFYLSKCISKCKKRIQYEVFFIIFFSALFYIVSPKFVSFISLFSKKLFIYSMNFLNYSISGLIMRIIILMIILYYRYKNRRDLLYRKMSYIYIVSFLEYVLFYNAYMFGTRINMFLRIIEIILFSRIFYNFSYKQKREKIILYFFMTMLWGSVYYKEVLLPYNSPYRINPYLIICNI